MAVPHWSDAFKTLPGAAQKAGDSPDVVREDAPSVEESVVQERFEEINGRIDKLQGVLAMQISDQQTSMRQMQLLISEHTKLVGIIKTLRKQIGYLFIASIVLGVIAITSFVLVMIRRGGL